MPVREVIGQTDCPECGFEHAEIRKQKNGLPYRYCGECGGQYFPRTDEAGARLLRRAKPAAGPVASQEPAPPAGPAPEPAKPAAGPVVSQEPAKPAGQTVTRRQVAPAEGSRFFGRGAS